MIEYCLGFVFDTGFQSVVLTPKERGLHVGTWNGLGGKIEPKERSFDAMRREYKEESNGHEIENWYKVGFIEGPNWLVHVFAAIDEDCVDTLTADHIIEHNGTGTAQIMLEGLERLPLAPLVNVLIAASVDKLRRPQTDIFTLKVH